VPFVDFPLSNLVQAVEPSTAHLNAKRHTKKRGVLSTRHDWNDSFPDRKPYIRNKPSVFSLIALSKISFKQQCCRKLQFNVNKREV